MINDLFGYLEIDGFLGPVLRCRTGCRAACVGVGIGEIGADRDRLCSLGIPVLIGFFDGLGGAHHLAVGVVFFIDGADTVEIHIGLDLGPDFPVTHCFFNE